MKMAVVRAVLMAAAASLLFNAATAADITVGGSSGWGLSTDFATWASSQRFTVGDKLIFQYGSSHNVVEVSKANYDSCSTSSPIGSYNDGRTEISLTAPGTRYFICGTPGHCPPMKVEIDVKAAFGSPSPPTTPPSPTPPSGTPATPESPSVPSSPSPTGSEQAPPRDSSGGRVKASFALGVAMVMAAAL